MTKSDLIIIGAGPGGYRAAEYAAKNGLTVTVFEESHLGGTCLNEGCIPTKSYAHIAEVLGAMRAGEEMGIRDLRFSFDFARAVARKDEIVSALRGGVETLLSAPGITLVREKAEFTGPKSVKSASGTEYEAANIIVATGSVPKRLRLEAEDPGVARDSDWLLHAERLPESLCIVGAGVIGMEFASIFNAFGVKVTVVEFLKECLPALDSDIAKRLRRVLEKRGVEFYLQSAVKAVTREGVTFERKGKRMTVAAEEVLVAVGRGPRVSEDFAAAGFAFDARSGIKVDDNMQTTVPGIYAIGDVNGRQMLAHAAEMQAVRAVNHILGKPDGIDLGVMPAATFTNPEAGQVGPSEDQLKAAGTAYTCRKAFWRSNGKALSMGETEGMLKLFAGEDGRILGCHAFGAHAADIAQEVSSLMCRGTTVEQLRSMVHIHPTLSEILKAAAE